MEQLKNKIISFKSIIINNINNEGKKTNKENNNNVDNKYIKNNESNNCENNIMVYKSENTVKKDNAKTKIKKLFCCL